MNRKIKALGLALVAALALTAVMASAASAQFTSSATHTILHGTQEGSHVFTAGEGFGGVTCSTATFSGTGVTTNDASQTITPTYSGCKDSFGRTVDIDNTGFTYQFTRTGKVGANAIGSVHVSGSMTLTITSGGSVICTVHITVPQTNTGVTYKNLGGTSGVTVETNTTGVKNTTTGSFFSCGISEGAHSEGTYVGNTIMTGKDTSGKAVEINVH